MFLVVVVVVVVVRFFNDNFDRCKVYRHYIHVTKYETKYGRLIQSIMHEPSQANNANK